MYVESSAAGKAKIVPRRADLRLVLDLLAVPHFESLNLQPLSKYCPKIVRLEAKRSRNRN
jgi:hypothetical protein